jgi:hypothetical protein
MPICDCSTATWGNTGNPNCTVMEGVTRGIVIVPMYDSTGAANKIANGATLNKAYFDALTNNTDPTKRWYPIQDLESVEDVRAEAQFYTGTSGLKYKIKDGVRSFKAMIMKKSFVFLGQLEKLACNEIGIYRIDSNDNAIGTTDGIDMYPTKLSRETFDSLKVFAKDDTLAHIMIQFDFDESEQDSNLRILESSVAGIKFTNLNGLVDVNVATSGVSNTGVILTLTHDYGTFGSSSNKVTDWLPADFKFENVTTGLAITGATVTETSDGVYVVIFPSQTDADVIRVSKAGTKLGFDLISTTFTIPVTP